MPRKEGGETEAHVLCPPSRGHRGTLASSLFAGAVTHELQGQHRNRNDSVQREQGSKEQALFTAGGKTCQLWKGALPAHAFPARACGRPAVKLPPRFPAAPHGVPLVVQHARWPHVPGSLPSRAGSGSQPRATLWRILPPEASALPLRDLPGWLRRRTSWAGFGCIPVTLAEQSGSRPAAAHFAKAAKWAV